ncbi:MAG: SGNH/GDSL hydrolase family protein [Desulfovibrionaceae bacterium]|nr:SGNH/GDSL hydrolase family protein [Desulfovibrionaceae bacterium]
MALVLCLILAALALVLGLELSARLVHFGRSAGLRGAALARAALRPRLALENRHRFAAQARLMGLDIAELHRLMAQASGASVEQVERVYTGPKSFESYEYRPFIGFHLRPGQDLSYTDIDRYGFQSDIRDFCKPPGVRRVVVLGGSVAFGIGALSRAGVWTRVLERMLNEASGPQGPAWEVVNMAYVAADSHSELNRALIYAAMFEPDYVVQVSGFNDLYFFLEHKKLYTFNFYDQVYRALCTARSGRGIERLGAFSVLACRLRALRARKRSRAPGGLDRDMIYTVW